MQNIKLKEKNLYFIGGVVRDELLNKESFDIDITYQGNAIEFAKTITDAQILQTNPDFGTVRIKLEDKEIDIASTRSETYPKKGHLPQVTSIGCDLKQDVLRRDFTINSLAKSTLTGEIIDYVGGLDDIKNKTLRVLHDNSFIDDPTRIIRGLKFATRFDFSLDEQTKELQDTYLKNVNYDMSYKRLKKELIETFELNSTKAFKTFVQDKIYKLITDKEFTLPNIDNLDKIIEKYKPQSTWIIYVGLIPDVEKLPLTKREAKILTDFYNVKTKKLSDDFEAIKTFSKVELETLLMLSIYKKNTIINYLENLKNIKIGISGNDLNKMGIVPSKKYQECFDYILKEKINNPLMTKSEELELAKHFFEKV